LIHISDTQLFQLY